MLTSYSTRYGACFNYAKNTKFNICKLIFKSLTVSTIIKVYETFDFDS